MSRYIIIENDDGLLVDQVGADESAEQVALAKGGVVVDAGPYATFEAAYDAMRQIPATAEELDDEL